MEFRLGIFVSVVIHMIIITAALAFTGGGAISRPRSDFIAISLQEAAHESLHIHKKIGDTLFAAVQKIAIDHDKGQGKTASENVISASPKNESSLISPDVKKADKGKEDSAGVMPQTQNPGEAFAYGGSMEGFSVLSGDYYASAIGTHKGELKNSGGHHKGDGISDVLGSIRASILKALVYPPLAKKRGFEGTAVAEFIIDSKGLPENIRIVKSSGFSILDSAAKDTLVRASPFPVIKGVIEIPITFKLKKTD